MTSLLEQIRRGGLTIPFGDADYSVEIHADRVVVNGCDCASVPTDAEVRRIHDALSAYLRIAKNRPREGT